MNITIAEKSFFTAAHYHDGELNEGEHSHTFHYEVIFEGQTNSEGFLIDFRKIQAELAEKINAALSGKTLNAVLSVPPTTENIAVWIFEKLKPVFPELKAVKLYETEHSWVMYEGEK